jgi:hypothetical protein
MNQQNVPADPEYDALLDQSLAFAIEQGDIVNFRLLFMPSSPFRPDSPEDASDSKYNYLFPDSDSGQRYPEALAWVHKPDIAAFVRAQLDRKGPPKLPWQLVKVLGDNAVRLGKYTAAAQAYELLRIRRRMQDIILDQADEHLREHDIAAAVNGYRIALGLQYDYGAFPEPLPAVPDYQERAPALHMTYPATQEQTLSLQSDEVLCKTALTYLLPFSEFASRFQQIPPEVILPFTVALVRILDVDWEAFATAFRQSLAITAQYEDLFVRINAYSTEILEVLEEKLIDDSNLEELRKIPEILAGSSGEHWEWWQYLKHLAYHHPGAALFVSRQRLSAKEEIVVPRVRLDSELARSLGLIG